MADKTIAAAEARRLLLHEYHGVLSTLSADAPGYPFGSVVPYCLDRQGRPVILISRIAQHTKNIQANPKVSLITVQGEVDDIQAAARLTYLANATRVPQDDDDTPARYYGYFPKAQGYHQVHGFDFYRLDLARARYIGGFGEIYWIEPAQLLLANPFSREEELRIVRHMNEDHEEAMIHYCQIAHIPLTEGTVPVMAGIDSEGFHLRLGARIIRFDFETPVKGLLEVRQALIALARK